MRRADGEEVERKDVKEGKTNRVVARKKEEGGTERKGKLWW